MTSSTSEPSTSDVMSALLIPKTLDKLDSSFQLPVPKYPNNTSYLLPPINLNNQRLSTTNTAAYPHFVVPSMPLNPFITPFLNHPLAPASSSIEQDSKKLFDYLTFLKSADIASSNVNNLSFPRPPPL